jgi:hypothetical protein
MSASSRLDDDHTPRTTLVKPRQHLNYTKNFPPTVKLCVGCTILDVAGLMELVRGAQVVSNGSDEVVDSSLRCTVVSWSL